MYKHEIQEEESGGRKKQSLLKIPTDLEILASIFVMCTLKSSFASKLIPKYLEDVLVSIDVLS